MTLTTESAVSSATALMSQCQFDALASFSYNVGAGYWNGSGNCYVRTVIMNTVVPPQDLSSSNPYGGKVTASTLPMYQDHSASSTQITTLKINTSVNIIDYYRDSSTKQSWYKVSASGKSSWVRAGDVAFNSTSRSHAYYELCGRLHIQQQSAGLACVGSQQHLTHHITDVCKLRYSPTAATPAPSNGNYKKNTCSFTESELPVS